MSCSNCNTNIKIYDTKDDLDYCYICYLTNFTSHQDVFIINIGVSKMTQEEINSAYNKYVQKNCKLPLHTDIDPDSKILKVNSILFLNMLQNINAKEKKQFKNIKIFFSDNIDLRKIKTLNILKKEKFIVQTRIHDKEQLNEKQHEIYMNYIKQV